MIGVTLVLMVLMTLAVAELLWPQKVKEGFESLVPVLSPRAGYFAKFVPRRGDLSEGSEQEGYIQDPRYFLGYADVQRLGFDHDFCRMVESKNNESIKFFACALAGTENLNGISFRTPTVQDGFRLSRDDYMRDIEGKGRQAYCRILKGKDGTYQPLCNRAMDTEFDTELVVDTEPPADIKTLLRFYEGCVFWYRFRDDMVDYVGNTKLLKAGGVDVKEKPNPPVAEGVRFNGFDQFLRLGDNVELELGSIVPLRSLRGLMVWVYFDEFTNNAHILDFGDGPGKNNVVLGIIGRGDSNISDAGRLRPPLLCGEDSTVPDKPSGAQPCPVMSPQELMKTTSANVNEFECVGFEENPRRLPPSRVRDKTVVGAKDKATLLYEIWDNQQRKMRITIPGIIPKGKWTHICITAQNEDAFRPDIGVFINGELSFLQPSGFLPQASTLAQCYLGKSNWSNVTSQYENKDELFKGRLFDVRGYKQSVTDKVIKESVAWGKAKLGLRDD
jgi:hypothetical protein